ncbi:uncharacterized protein LOC142658873 [Rhinoderma darwinii]|uniref:uncharacterized protein LOC142658873 n=1 Tax=Rhinoderma darwinii TaxID=43563 RepID=UPI003F66B2F0
MSSRLIRNDLLDLNSPNEVGKSELSVNNDGVFINVNVQVSIPPAENGSAQIVSSALTMSEDHPCLFIIIADEIEQCNKSSNANGSCKSLNKEPELIVALTGVVNYAKSFTYKANVTGQALCLTIYMEDTLTIVPTYFAWPGNTTVYLNFMFESFQDIHKNANSSDVFVNVQTMYTPTEPTNVVPTTMHNGQSGLCPGPLSTTMLLIHLAVFLFN